MATIARSRAPRLAVSRLMGLVLPHFFVVDADFGDDIRRLIFWLFPAAPLGVQRARIGNFAP